MPLFEVISGNLTHGAAGSIIDGSASELSAPVSIHATAHRTPAHTAVRALHKIAMSPPKPKAGGATPPPSSSPSSINNLVAFANKQVQCANPNCSVLVAIGQGQSNYQCAEFTARSLSAGGFVPGLSPTGPQSSYANYQYNGKTYPLWNTYGLRDYLTARGWVKQAPSQSSVKAGCAVFGDAGNGPMSHVCVGVGNGILNCHNNARRDIAASNDFFKGIDTVLCPNWKYVK